jgi:hypothetical protein
MHNGLTPHRVEWIKRFYRSTPISVCSVVAASAKHVCSFFFQESFPPTSKNPFKVGNMHLEIHCGCDDFVVWGLELDEFGAGKGIVVEIGMYAGKENMNEVGVSVGLFGMCVNGGNEAGLPVAAGDGLALEKVVAVFVIVLACGTVGVVTRGAFMESGICGKEPTISVTLVNSRDPPTSTVALAFSPSN